MKTNLKNIAMAVVLPAMLSLGCNSSNNQAQQNTVFDWVSDLDEYVSIPFSRNQNIVITQSNVSETFNLSEILNDVSYIILEESPFALIGDVDKIMFNDSLIFIQDKYIHNSLQIFSREGKFIHAILPSGEGPKEFREVTDFDLDENGIYIFDAFSAKISHIDFDFIVQKEIRVPLRASTFRKIGEAEWLFFIIDDPNGHLLDFEKSDIIWWDSNNNDMKGFNSSFFDHRKSDFSPRDVSRNNSGNITAMLRYHPEIYEWNLKDRSLECLVSFDLTNIGLTTSDFKKISSDFIKDRGRDQKFYTFGEYLVTEDWIGVVLDRIKAKPLHLFYNRNSNNLYSGTSINFDFPGIISFSMPKACKGNECVSFSKGFFVEREQLDSFILGIKEKGLYTKKLEQLLRSVHEPEVPVLMFFNLK